MSDYTSLCIVLIFTLGVIGVIAIAAVTCAAIYLREVVSLKGKAKIDQKNKTLETELNIDNKKEKEPPEK